MTELRKRPNPPMRVPCRPMTHCKKRPLLRQSGMSIARTTEEGSLLVGQCGDRLSERRPAAFHERGQIPFKVVGPHIPRLNAETQIMAQPIKTLDAGIQDCDLIIRLTTARQKEG
jgi:hypothetical protein